MKKSSSHLGLVVVVLLSKEERRKKRGLFTVGEEKGPEEVTD